MTCLWNGCKHYKDPCNVYGYKGMKLRIRLGYCPIADKFFDAEREEAYMKEKFPNRKKRVGQQKQKSQKIR